MLKNFILKEIKDLEIYKISDNSLVRRICSLSNVILENGDKTVITLKGCYDRYSENYKLKCNGTAYNIKGCPILQDVNTGEIYIGKFEAPYVVIEYNKFPKIQMCLLQPNNKDKTPYIITVLD
jgi:hypothetical protein